MMEYATDTDIDELCINTIRTLSIDAVEQAKSGHPGAPMALAPLVYTVWNRVMQFDPKDPIWPNRDRFVLSNGHASMLLWSVLHLTRTQAVNAEYENLGQPSVAIEDIRRFRQIDSKAPGHPEYHWVSGVEATTGPLGQGVATSVGMAIAEKWLAHRYNRPNFPIFDYRIYAVCGDGCMMEGIASEAASLTGHLGLDNLCWIYDNNRITIEGSTSITFTEDVAARFAAYGWNILRIRDANDLQNILHVLEAFKKEKGRPTFIVVDSHIGYGSRSKQDTAAAHGEALGEEEVRLTKRAYGWPEDAQFLVPPGVYEHFSQGIGARGENARRDWMKLFEAYRVKYPELAAEIGQIQRRELPDGWDNTLPEFPADPKGLAGREASGKVLNALAQNIPWFLGGSADLGPSNKTLLTYPGAGDFQFSSPGGKNLHYGIREHTMGAIVNGLCLSKLRAFGATFFVFSDYARPAIRLSALMELPAIFIFTHDAMGDGEDGPTHQPVEHLASLRAIPGLTTLRPGDANEVVEAYRYILQLRHEPAALVLSRQALPTLDRSRYAPASGLMRGAYVLADAGGEPELILIASGSELSLAADAHERLVSEGIRSRVVSMPSWDIFEHQSQKYRDTVLPPNITARVAIEQAATFGWERYVGATGRVIGMSTFGASAPLKELQRKFGFEPERVVAVAKELLEALRIQIAARERAEAELRHLASGLEAKVRRLVNANVIGIVIWNLEGAITDANEAFLQMVQFAREDLVSGRVRWTDLTPAKWHDRDERAKAELEATGIFQPFEKKFFRKDGSQVPVLIGGALFKEGENEGVAFVLDLSVQQRAEEALRRTQEELRQMQAEFAHVNRVMTMGELAASIAHEVNQPLAAIVASCDSCTAWLAREPPNLDKARAAASRIAQAATQAKETVQNVRALFRKETSVAASVDVNEVIEATISFVRPEAERMTVSMRTELDAALPFVAGDRVQLQQVILNLMMNGIEAMADLDSEPKRLVIRSVLPNPGELLVSVADTGPGIDVEHADRLFAPFLTNKPQGIGMGLRISRSIIEAHGGRLWADKNEPRGATFHFTLPLKTRIE